MKKKPKKPKTRRLPLPKHPDCVLSPNESKEIWLCPWNICNAEQAEKCRTEMKPQKGCGGRFPGMNAHQAKLSIRPKD